MIIIVLYIIFGGDASIFSLFLKIIFEVYLFSLRERESESGGGAEREGRREKGHERESQAG